MRGGALAHVPRVCACAMAGEGAPGDPGAQGDGAAERRPERVPGVRLPPCSNRRARSKDQGSPRCPPTASPVPGDQGGGR